MGWLMERVEKGVGDVVIKLVMFALIGAPWFFYQDLSSQVKEKATKQEVQQQVSRRMDKLEGKVEKLDTVIREQQRVVDRLDWWLDQQQEMRAAPDSLRRTSPNHHR